jgi:hypothetical protein
MVADGLYCVDGDIHWAQDRAGAVGFAGCFHPADLKNAEQICNTEYGSVWAGVFAPRSFDKQ